MRPLLSGVILCGCVIVSGCGTGSTDYRGFYAIVRQGWETSFNNNGVSLKEAAAIPYASMGWRLNGGDQHLIILATDTSGDQIWTSKAHIVLQTNSGLIRRTVGLPTDLEALTPHNASKLTSPVQALLGAYTDIRVVDLARSAAFGVTVTCQGRVSGKQAITILGKSITTIRVTENCRAPALEWSFRNMFWIDPEKATVWRTEQSVAPGEVVQTELFRPEE